MEGHRTCHILEIAIACFAFLVAVLFNALSAQFIDLGLFVNSTGALSDAYYNEITPAGWTFSIWGFIYAWQVLFLVYVLSTICRRGPNKGYLYYDPGHMPAPIFLLYAINMGFNVGWLFLFDRQYMHAALGFIAMLPFTLYIMLFLTCKGLVDHGKELISSNGRKEIWLVRILVHNGLGIYATWVTIATLLNLTIVLKIYAGFEQSMASTISLGVLSFEILAYWILDNFIIDRYVRYLFTPYIVVHVALIGSIAKNWDPVKRNSIFTAVLLGVGALLTIIKIVLVIWRSITRPIFSDSDRLSESSELEEKNKM